MVHCTKDDTTTGVDLEQENHYPYVPSYPTPADNKDTLFDTSVVLEWQGGDIDSADTVTYVIYLDTVSPARRVIDTIATDTSYRVSGLLFETRYYWRVVANDGEYTSEGNVWTFHTKYKEWNSFVAVRDSLPNNQVSELFVAGDNTVWIGTSYNGVAIYDGSGQWQTFNATSGDIPDGEVTDIAIDKEGKKWVALWDKGVVSTTDGSQWTAYDSIGEKVRLIAPDSISSSDGKPGHRIHEVCVDKLNGKWMSSIHGFYDAKTRKISLINEIIRFDGEQWIVFTSEDFNPLFDEKSKAIALDTAESGEGGFGTLWAVTIRGLYSTGSIDTVAVLRDSIIKEEIAITYEDDWDSTIDSSNAYADYQFQDEEPDTDTTITDEPETEKANTLDVDSFFVQRDTVIDDTDTTVVDTVYFIGDSSNVVELDEEYYIDKDSVYTISDTALEWSKTVQYDDTLWVEFDSTVTLDSTGTVTVERDDDKLVKTERTLVYRKRSTADAQFTLYMERIPLSGVSVSDSAVTFLEIDGSDNKWVGTRSDGLLVYNGSAWKAYRSDNSNLPNDHVTTVAFDANDDMWIGTRGGGLAYYRRSEKRWEIYNTLNSGIASDHVLSVAVDSDGTIWIGTNAGLNRFEPR
jgi:hypothetical protein